jgi:diguanylate cyclase (GGDEF)-like protein
LTSDVRREKQRGVLLASAGYALALVIIYLLSLYMSQPLPLAHWMVLIGGTLIVQAVLWAAPTLGLDVRLGWDPHYVYVPMLANALVLSAYIYFVPPARMMLLMGWFASLGFVAGLIGFSGVAALSVVMTVGYLAALALRRAEGLEMFVPFEMLVAFVFLAVNLYIGVIYERLQRQRDENRILRRELHEQAITDPLTGLFNRRQFEYFLRIEVSRIQRYGGQTTLAIIDLDFFKAYNDRFGHVAGDLILKELANVMQRQIRSSDLLARYGGEEFALVMPGFAKQTAMIVLERLRKAVEDHPFKDEQIMPRGNVTVSIGVASCPDDGKDFESLVRRADEALYAAKESGRNLVHIAATS